MVARTAELIGVDRLGIGSDMCRKWGPETLAWMRSGRWTRGEGEAPQWPEQPAWFRTPADMPQVVAGLRAQGFAPEELAKIMGSNWLRFFSDGFEPRG